jgi:hypothetical protein
MLFNEMNKKELKEFEEKLKNIHKTIAEGFKSRNKRFFTRICRSS